MSGAQAAYVCVCVCVTHLSLSVYVYVIDGQFAFTRIEELIHEFLYEPTQTLLMGLRERVEYFRWFII